jgi:peptidoglycan hydrolase-like protein with peptidoglycan-binding domain
MDTEQLQRILESNGIDPDTIAAILAKQEQSVVPVMVKEDQAPDPTPTVEETPKRPELRTAVTDFMGYQIMVKMPTLEQITVIKRLSKTFAEAAKGKITAERAAALGNRAIKAICSVVARPEDVETIEDLMLEGQTFESLIPLIVTAMDELRKANQAPAPAGAPAATGAVISTGQ